MTTPRTIIPPFKTAYSEKKKTLFLQVQLFRVPANLIEIEVKEHFVRVETKGWSKHYILEYVSVFDFLWGSLRMI
jgi:hypothetical protein